MAKVLVWQSQLAANDFPPVCAMTGQQAETWRRFSFSTSPGWSFWVGGLLAAALTARRASGHLPLTRASANRLRNITWGLASLFPIAVLLFGIGAVAAGSDSVSSTVELVVLALGFAVFMIGLIGLLIVRRTYGPTGKVLEPQPGYYQSLVELDNVHPAFADAVQQLQSMRAQQR